ncbi:MAG TPA: hypothetical protein VIJ11_10165 [Galbitalea sp.]
MTEAASPADPGDRAAPVRLILRPFSGARDRLRRHVVVSSAADLTNIHMG